MAGEGRPLRRARRWIRDVVSVVTYGYLARWLWSFERDYGNLRNIMTMAYGFVCLLWTPRFTPRSMMYTVFAVGVYGFVIKSMWWTVNRDYLRWGSKALAAVFGVKCARLTLGLVADVRAGASEDTGVFI
jgi:hypothetical protein